MNNQQSAQAWFDSLVYDNSVIAKAMADNHFFDIQNQAQSRLATVSIPQRKQEAWRYTDLRSLYRQRFISPDVIKPEPMAELFDDWVYGNSESYRLVMLNGQFSADLSNLPLPVEGVTIKGLNEISDTQRNQVTAYLAEENAFSDDMFDVVNRSLFQDGYFIHLGKQRVLKQPIEIVHLVIPGDQSLLAQPRSVVLLEPSAELQLVERFIGFTDASYFHNSLLRVQLGDNAQLQHVRLQQENREAHHLSRVLISQQRDSRYHLMNVATGSKWGRSDIHVTLQGEQADCQIQGLYTVADGQYNDIHLDVSHLAPHCNSELKFNGLLLGAGRGVFDGRILVDQLAQKTNAQMSNHNLMLDEQADIDTKPVLEIYADDVKCSHGATVGSIDPEQLFYCQSRGLSRHQAVRLLCKGFARQVIENLQDSTLLQYVESQVNTVLQQEGSQR
jgi:Fe-S cluster assembly protein SufD